MHIDYTIHFWTLVAQIVGLSGLFSFLWKVYKNVRSVVQAAIVILEEHREVYNWYSMLKEGKFTGGSPQ